MECKLCEQPITNPLCQDCLGEATEEWLREKAPERIEDLRKQTEIISCEGGVRCVRCKKEFSICMYCYTKHVFNWLQEGSLQLQYIKIFNFLT